MSLPAEPLPCREPVPMLTAWHADGLVNRFAGRTGGVSGGPYATLNLARGVGDDPAAVETNWRRLKATLPPYHRITFSNQVHGSVVRVIARDAGAPADGARPLKGDGMVTAVPGVLLAVFTADCVPVVMVDVERRIAGVVHAGWRGVLAGVVEGGLAAMRRLGARPQALRAALGPAIGPCCFQVDEKLAARFVREVAGAARFRLEGPPGKARLDLRAIVALRLEQAGLDPRAVRHVGPCTKCASHRYFSRRAAGGTVTGLQVSVVGFVD